MLLDPDIFLLEKKLESGKASLDDRLRLATLYLDRGYWDYAMQECILMMQDNQPTPLPLMELVSDLFIHGQRNQEAMLFMSNIVNVDPSYKPNKIRFNMGLCAARVGNLQEAKESLAKLIKEDPEYPQAKAMLKGIKLVETHNYHASAEKMARRPVFSDKPSLIQRIFGFLRRD